MNFRNESSSAFVGTCKDLEKDYFRLTSAPDASKVRPLKMLERSFEFVMGKYRSNGDWRYLSNQLKSIRQDLLVQSIRNDFARMVYEENARLAIKMKDREQFVQCQTQLEILYEQTENRTGLLEFLIYRLLYCFFLSDWKRCNKIVEEIEDFRRGKLNDEEEKRIESIFEFCSTLKRRNVFRFVESFESLTELEKSLVEIFVELYRKEIVKTLIVSFLPSVPVEFCRKLLLFDSAEKCESFLENAKIPLLEGKTTIDCKTCRRDFGERQN